MVFDSFFAEKVYDKPNIDSKLCKQGNQDEKSVTYWPTTFNKVFFS